MEGLKQIRINSQETVVVHGGPWIESSATDWNIFLTTEILECNYWDYSSDDSSRNMDFMNLWIFPLVALNLANKDNF